MGLLDRWRKRRDEVAVPPGHRVGLYGAGPLPGLASSEGGVWIAELGTSSDEATDELDAVLTAIEARRAGPRPRVLLTNVAGPLSSLFAPSNPELVPREGLLLWSVDADALATARDGPALSARLFDALDGYRADLAQTLFVRGKPSRRAQVWSALASGLGVAVRRLEPSSGDALLVEVHRPEGVVLSALLGAPLDGPDSVVAPSAQARRTRLGRELAPGEGEPRLSAVARAPGLVRLLLACAGGASEAWRALTGELARRQIPLLAIVDPKTRAAAVRGFPGGLRAIPLYPDEDTLLAAARDMGAAPGSFAIATLSPREAFAWVAAAGSAATLTAYCAPGEPLHVPLDEGAVRALADGRVPGPTRPGRPPEGGV